MKLAIIANSKTGIAKEITSDAVQWMNSACRVVKVLITVGSVFLTMAQKIKTNIRHLLFETVTGGDFDDSLDIGWHKHYAETI